MKFDSCYKCPNYSHKGAFGNPRYAPLCNGKPLPKKVDEKNYASPNLEKIKCEHLNK